MKMKRLTSLLLASAMALSLAACGNADQGGDKSTAQKVSATTLKDIEAPGEPENIPEALQVDFNKRFHYAELEDVYAALHEQAPDITEFYAIGSTWQERSMWCLEITNKSIPEDQKIGIGVFGPIHGEEPEAAISAMYTAWWMILNRDTDYMKAMLDQYIIYVVPAINPDGYEQSFVYPNRSNLRPMDRNGDGVPFSDPYADIDGDGFIADIYSGTADKIPTEKLSTDWTKPELNRFGMESPDWDGNHILGDDPRGSGIDMNRTFNYQWNRFDAETYAEGATEPKVGAVSWHVAGSDAATEPEVRAMQNFLAQKSINASVNLHTGMQAVFYPWCYKAYDPNDPADAELGFMEGVAEQMRSKMEEVTGRGFYQLHSYDDYPTSAEMIDYAYGTFNIHAYTIEVYEGGKTGDPADCRWENDLPEEKWVFYSQDDIREKLGLDPTTLVSAWDGSHLAANEGLWFHTTTSAQCVREAPEEQDIMVKAAKDAILIMIENEPHGEGYQRPFFVK